MKDKTKDQSTLHHHRSDGRVVTYPLTHYGCMPQPEASDITLRFCGLDSHFDVNLTPGQVKRLAIAMGAQVSCNEGVTWEEWAGAWGDSE